MAEWFSSPICPECGSEDTRFVEPLNDQSLYECNVCGCRFEVDDSRG